MSNGNIGSEDGTYDGTHDKGSEDEALRQARELIRLAKEKMAKTNGGTNNEGSNNEGNNNEGGREAKVKRITDSGVVADSKAMVEDSEKGEWSRRSISEIFSINELSSSSSDDNDPNSENWSKLKERDAAATVMGLRKTMNPEDFQKIFDDRNPRIGKQ